MKWKEVRVHFSVNCASVCCPPLRKKIYIEENLDDVLSENTQRALKTHRHLHRDGRTLYLSSLFRWYTQDYETQGVGLKFHFDLAMND